MTDNHLIKQQDWLLSDQTAMFSSVVAKKYWENYKSIGVCLNYASQNFSFSFCMSVCKIPQEGR